MKTSLVDEMVRTETRTCENCEAIAGAMGDLDEAACPRCGAVHKSARAVLADEAAKASTAVSGGEAAQRAKRVYEWMCEPDWAVDEFSLVEWLNRRPCEDARHLEAALSPRAGEAVPDGLREALGFIETYKQPWGAAKSEFWEEYGFARSGKNPTAHALDVVEMMLRSLLASRPASDSGEAGGVEHGTGRASKLAEGCCSAISPCPHQQRDPSTICGMCQKAADLARSICSGAPASDTPSPEIRDGFRTSDEIVLGHTFPGSEDGNVVEVARAELVAELDTRHAAIQTRNAELERGASILRSMSSGFRARAEAAEAKVAQLEAQIAGLLEGVNQAQTEAATLWQKLQRAQAALASSPAQHLSGQPVAAAKAGMWADPDGHMVGELQKLIINVRGWIGMGASERAIKAIDEARHDGWAAIRNSSAASAGQPVAADRDGWRPIETAPKDGTRILVVLKEPIPRKGRPDLDAWAGVPFVAKHPGIAANGFDIGWSFAAPVGHGGFPDDWIAGWQPLPTPPQAAAPAPSADGSGKGER